MPTINTERLIMNTLTADMMETALKGNKELEKKVPYKVASEWPMDVYKALFPYKIERFRKFPHENKWEGVIMF